MFSFKTIGKILFLWKKGQKTLEAYKKINEPPV
jgi:hypothetical protein